MRASKLGRRVRVHGGWLRVLRNTVVGFHNQAGTRMAAALSYYSIFVAGPTLILTLWLGTLLFGEEATREAVARLLSRALPPNAGAANAVASEVVRRSTPTASLAILVGMVSLFGFTRALTTSLNVTMNAEGREPLHRTIVVAPLLLAAVAGLLWGAWALEIAIDVVEVATGTGDDSLLGHLLGGFVPLALAAVYFAMILSVVPRVQLSRTEVLVPAAVGAVLWEAARQVFGWLVGTESIYLEVFGPLGGVVALLGWVYLSSAILVLIGQFTWAFAMERRGRGRLAAELPREAGLSGRIQPLEADNVVNEASHH
ncbi:MAG: YihY/virulence factor BrkB family protein [Chloroflexota bacterium]|nr:YihY/virulence factor BrkB family protein [Chloroflexota bacterium]